MLNELHNEEKYQLLRDKNLLLNKMAEINELIANGNLNYSSFVDYKEFLEETKQKLNTVNVTLRRFR